MTASAVAERSRGRPRGFDEETVLDAVIELFWEQGFEAASLADIVDVAGLNKSSLYNAFGSKDELFLRALERYIDGREQMLDAATTGDRGLADVHVVVGLVRAEATSAAGRRGCLAVNSSAELGFDNPAVVALAQRFREAMRRSVRRPIERAAELGEIDSALVDVYVDTTMSYMLAIALSARGGADASELERHLDSMDRLIESWRIA